MNEFWAKIAVQEKDLVQNAFQLLGSFLQQK